MSRLFTLLYLALIPTLTAYAQQDKYALPSVAAEKDLPGEGTLRRYDGYVKTWQRLRSQWATQVEKKTKMLSSFLATPLHRAGLRPSADTSRE